MLVLGVAFWSRNLSHIVWAVVISAALQWLYALWCLKGLHNVWALSNFDGFKEQLAYTIPLGLSLLVGVLSVQLDKLMISGFFNPEQFAVFSLGAMELPLIGILINSVNAILLPNLSAMDKQSMSEVYSASVRKNAIIVFPLAVVFFIFAGEFITFIYGSIYSESALYFRIYLLLLPLRVATYGIIFQACGKTRLVMYDAIIMLLLNTVLNYILIKAYGMQGAAWATVIVSWLILGVYLWQIKYPLGLKLSSLFPLWRLIKTFICGFAAF
ncbi:MAG: oligosaccharide flippase family protein [Candidatus Cloacimonetes bacterium]|nr:oligosaccharide flippase family protein [Candidatus Cloacimonadota bacterium]